MLVAVRLRALRLVELGVCLHWRVLGVGVVDVELVRDVGDVARLAEGNHAVELLDLDLEAEVEGTAVGDGEPEVRHEVTVKALGRRCSHYIVDPDAHVEPALLGLARVEARIGLALDAAEGEELVVDSSFQTRDACLRP